MAKLRDVEEQLRQHYLDRIPDKISTLETALAGLGEPDPKEAGDDLRALGHKIAGTAASFGFPELGRLGREAELASPEELQRSGTALLSGLRSLLPR